MLFTAALALQLGARAQTEPTVEIVWTGPVDIGARVVERTATVSLGYVIFSVAPVLPPPPFTVVAGTKVKFNVPAPGAAYGPVHWLKDGRSLSGSDATLEIVAGGADTNGQYSADGGSGIALLEIFEVH